ncbi:hypothetical protein ILYODFUR_012949 [Ilyodon furcidens]|uniref:DIX domain-containing protein n=1 Tax=Ilyodon furcidens TaxID=33524 RepID=A0ABV0U504_9TELE
MSVAEDAFTFGDFSLSISDLNPADIGLYSCHLHHHYCGLHERRIFRLTVTPPLLREPTTSPRVFLNDELEPKTEKVSTDKDNPRVVNVFLPEQRGHFVQHLGYFLATFLLLAIIVFAVIVLTRRRKKRGLEYETGRSVGGNVISGGEIELDCTEMRTCNQDPLNSEYKNNLMKERDMVKECNKEFDGKMWNAERATVAPQTVAGIRTPRTRLCPDFRRVCRAHGAALRAAGCTAFAVRERCNAVLRSLMAETKIIYHIDEEETPYLVKLSVPPEKVTLADFKNVLNNRPVNSYKFFFKSMDQDFGVVKEEISDDNAKLPCFNGRVVSWDT